MSNVEKNMCDRMMENMTQLRQNYLRLMQEIYLIISDRTKHNYTVTKVVITKNMFEKQPIKVLPGSRISPSRFPLSLEEQAKAEAKNGLFAQRCREIFWRVYPELVEKHYNWFILIEPESGEYLLAPDEATASQAGHEKYPKSIMLMKRLNETGTCGYI